MSLDPEKILNKYIVRSEKFNDYTMDEEERQEWKFVFESIVEHILEDMEIVNVKSELKEPQVLTSVETDVQGQCYGAGTGVGTCIGRGVGSGDGEVVHPDTVEQINNGKGLVR